MAKVISNYDLLKQCSDKGYNIDIETTLYGSKVQVFKEDRRTRATYRGGFATVATDTTEVIKEVCEFCDGVEAALFTESK